MEQKLGRLPVMVVTLLAAAAAFVLRLSQLRNLYDETGRIAEGAGKAPVTWFCLVMVVVFAAWVWLLRPRKKDKALASKDPVVLLATLAAALGLVLGSAAMVMDLQNNRDVLLAAGGVICAICWAVLGLERYRGREIHPMLLMIPSAYYAIRLLLEFRVWSWDPMILDYCFDLLTLICVTCATFHLGGFCFDKGRRRLTVFYCCCGILFGAAAIAGGRMRELAMTGGAMLWLAANLWVLLRPGRKRPE